VENAMVLPLLTMNIHFKTEGQESKTGPIWEWVPVGMGRGKGEGEGEQYGQLNICMKTEQ
jgi:hypothetical protein